MIAVAHITATPPGTFVGNVDWFTVKHPDYAPHDLVDPSTHQWQQFVPYSQPSKALLNQPGGVETNNRPGGVYQVEIVADEQCTDYSDAWYAWLDDFLRVKAAQLSIPYVFYPGIDRFTFEAWMAPTLVGWYRHINVPENDHRCSWLLDLKRLAQPKKDDPSMPDYILRNGRDAAQPWLAVYPDGKLRHVGGTEAGCLINGHYADGAKFGDGVPLQIVDEMDTEAYNRARSQAGA